MKAFRTLLLFVIGLLISVQVISQYAYKGIVTDQKGRVLQRVKVFLHSSGQTFFTNSEGVFSFSNKIETDSISFSVVGYEKLTKRINASSFAEIKLKILDHLANRNADMLRSFAGNINDNDRRMWVAGNETYTTLLENPILKTENYPATSIILNANRASYSNIRRFINMNVKVPFDAVRIEEMLNYFNLHYTEPPKDSLFSISSYRTTCPWNLKKELLYIQVNTPEINVTDVPPGNLVFLIDVSGSMDLPNRLPLLKSSFRKLVQTLRPIDTISIVIYGGATGIYLPPTSGLEKAKIDSALDGLSAGGSTPGEAGIVLAYDVARRQYIENGNNRIILATDGDFNVGQKNEAELDLLITKMKSTGIYLTCLGVGMGNYKDSKIEILARKGNGNFAYLDSEAEGEKVLVSEFTQTLFTTADDVYMDVRFNPQQVGAYRLIGYNNVKGIFSDTLTSIEGGELGYGYSCIALFEVEPTDKKENVLAELFLHYKPAGIENPKVLSTPINPQVVPFDLAPPYYQLAGSIALFGLKLRQFDDVKEFKWKDLIDLTSKNIELNNPQQNEFLEILLKAQRIYTQQRKSR